jgi:hypothetical protein
MYAFYIYVCIYICLAAYLLFTYHERIKCIYIFSIYINMRAAVSAYTRPGPVTDRAGPCLDRAKFVPCHGPNGRPALFGHLYCWVISADTVLQGFVGQPLFSRTSLPCFRFPCSLSSSLGLSFSHSGHS